MHDMDNPRKPLCPSYRPEFPDARAFAVVVGTPELPEVAYMKDAKPVDDALLALAGDVDPTEVFRFAGPCAGPRCQHFDRPSGNCRLVQRSVRLFEVETERLAPCAIRAQCKWWRQEGRAACERCPGIVSSHSLPTEIFIEAARPKQPATSATPDEKTPGRSLADTDS